MREWLTVIFVLLLVGIILDGLRRMRLSRQNSIRMSPNLRHEPDADEVDFYGSELPNGGARVVSERHGEEPAREPEQVALNLEESVPMLMEVDSLAEPGAAAALAEASFAAEETSEPERIEPSIGDPVLEAPVQQEQQSQAEPAPAEEVLVINVMAPIGQSFGGQALLDAILECGMRFGDMNIFHRHLETSGEGPVLFSLANMVKPGVFDLNAMSSFESPGVTLFMMLPLEADSLKAFDVMAATIHQLSQRLGGELKDEDRSVLTLQTLEHYRQRISEFERKRLSRNR